MGSILRWSGLVCTLAATPVLLAGCSSSGHAAVATRSAPLLTAASSPPSTSPRSTGAAPSTPRVDVAFIAVHDRDLSNGYSVHLIPGGDQVAGQVTLDNCGFDFTTEADRVARRQYIVLTAASAQTGLSNEVVAYDTAAHADEALRQWHRAAATCPHTPVHSQVASEPDTTTNVTHNRLNATTLPVKSNAVTTETATATGRGKLYAMAILQVHGRYLDAVYLISRTPATSQATNAAQRLALITGRRLATVG